MLQRVAHVVVLSSLVAAFSTASPTARAQEEFLRGDVNTDGQVSLSDSLMLRRWLFDGQAAPPCLDAADVDDNGLLNLTDQIRIIVFAFNFPRHLVPPSPYPEVGTDPTDDDGVPCETYDEEEPEETDDLVRLGDVSGAPGQAVEVPVFVSNQVAVEAFQLALRYDPATFSPEFTKGAANLSLDGTFYERVLTEEPPTFGGIFAAEEGVALVGFVPNLIFSGWELPPGEETLVFRIPGTIPADAEPGTVVRLELTNGEDDEGFGPAAIRNELTHMGNARFINTRPRLEGALLAIVSEEESFLRGDADGNGELNLGDAQYALGYLFRGGPTPLCLDAADSNDDGALNITDPVYLLRSLFSSAGPLPAPYPAPGADPTSDELNCGS